MVDERTRNLIEAKRADSRAKQQRVTTTLARLCESGSRISFARLAREANVSTWLLYNTAELKTAIHDAIERQNREGRSLATAHTTTSVTHTSLGTDLALARAEIVSLKKDRDTLRKRIERVIGSEISKVDHHRLTERITELEQLLTTARTDLAEATRTVTRLTAANEELAEQLDAVRILNHKLIRQTNNTEIG